MAHYVVLGSFTDEGVRAVKETAKRAKGLREAASAMGVKVKDIYWTMGPFDVILTMETASDEAVTSLMMKVGSMGKLKTQTLRAFGEADIEGILSKF